MPLVGNTHPLFRTTQKIQSQFNQAAPHYDQHAVVQKSIVHLLLDLALSEQEGTQQSSQISLDLGCGTGYLSQVLRCSHPQENLLNLDLSFHMLQSNKTPSRVQADFHSLPFQSSIFDTIYSSSALHWAYDPLQVATEINRVLKPGGNAYLGLFISGSLKEIQSSWQKTDGSTHTMNFPSLTEYHTIFYTSGLKIAQTRQVSLPLIFQSPKEALLSLKKIGSKWLEQKPHLISLSQLKQFEQYYWQDYRRLDSTIPLTYVVGLMHLKK